jgi:hypothetical protein
MDRDDDGGPGAGGLSATAEAVRAAVRRSMDVVQEFLETTSRQVAVITSLEAELASARARIALLEHETARLRTELTSQNHPSPDEIEALVEEQNALAHLFVSSDRLARARTPREALEIGIEVLHNLAGVHRYAVLLRPRPGGPLRMVAPSDPRFAVAEHDAALTERALTTGAPARRSVTAGLPVAVPLLLDGATVGVIEIRELVPQVGDRLGRLQDDLLQFLSDRLAPAMCQAGQNHQPGEHDGWASLAATIPTTDERSR